MLMDQIRVLRENRVKDCAKTLDLSNWQDGFAVY